MIIRTKQVCKQKEWASMQMLIYCIPQKSKSSISGSGLFSSPTATSWM